MASAVTGASAASASSACRFRSGTEFDEHGAVVYDDPLVPAPERVPIDPLTDVPDGYTPEQRGRPGGFVADPDVMDTWATSSLTPQIAALTTGPDGDATGQDAAATGQDGDAIGQDGDAIGQDGDAIGQDGDAIGQDAAAIGQDAAATGQGADDRDNGSRLWQVFPMDLRPQAHDIIRTWLFTTVLRSHLDYDVLPWRGAAISGWVLDPDRKKMSKSKGNVVTPIHLLEEHGADGVRYWAANGRPGTDTAFDTKQMRIGRKLAVKLLNASKFALAELPPAGELLSHPLDRAAVARLADVVDEATASFEAYDYARALQRTEQFFWWFCDYYLELIKGRRYDSDRDVVGSVSLALRVSLSTFQRLFAPFLPFVSEEVWSWWQHGSVHRASWPSAAELHAHMTSNGRAHVEQQAIDVTADVLREVRTAKSQAQAPMRAPVRRVQVSDTQDRLEALQLGLDDLVSAGAIEQIELAESDEFAVERRARVADPSAARPGIIRACDYQLDSPS